VADTRTAKTILTAEDRTASAFASFQKSIGETKDKITGMQASLAGLVTGGVIGGFAAMVMHALEAADQIGKLAQKAGIATEEMSKLAYAAKLSDVDAAQLSKGIKGLSEQMVKAGDETSKASAIMKAMGVDIRGGVSEALSKIADTFKNMPDGATKTALAVEVFGKAGQDLIPMLNQGAAGIEKLKVEAEKLGLVISDDTAKAAEQFNDNMKAIETSAGALGRTIVNDVGPAFAAMTDAIKDAYIEGGKWQALIEAIGQTGRFAMGEYISETTKMKRELADLTAQFYELAKARAEPDSLFDKIFGTSAKLDTRINQVTQRMSELRVELTKGANKKALIAADQSAFDGLYGTPGDNQGASEETIRNLLAVGGAAKQAKSDLAGLDKLLGEIFGKGAGYAADFAEKMSTLALAFTTGRIDAATFGAATAALIAQQPIVTKGLEEQAKAMEHLAKWYADLRQAELDEINARDDLLNAFEDGNAQLQIEVATLGMTATQRDLYVLGLQKEALLKAALTEKDIAYINKLTEERAALLQNREAAANQVSVWNDLADVIVNTFHRGKDALKDFLRSMLELFAKKYILQIGAAMTGSTSLSAAANTLGQGSAAGSLGNLLGLGGTAGIFGSSAAYGAAIGTTSVGAGSQAAMLAAQTGEFGAAGLGATAGAAGGTGAMLAAAGPYIAFALVAYGLYKAFAAKAGGPKEGGSYSGMFNDVGALSSGSSPGWYGVSTQNANVQQLVGSTGLTLAQSIARYGGTTSGFGISLGYDADPRGTANSRLTSSLTDASGKVLFGHSGMDIGRGNEGEALGLEMSRLIVEGIKASNINEQVKALFDGFTGTTQADFDALFASADELNNVLTQLATVTISGLTVDSLKQMALAGESLSQTAARVTGSFAQLQDLFSTDAEKRARDEKMIADAFASVNVAVPESIAGFKALIDSLDLSTDAGRALYNVLVATGPKFKQLMDDVGTGIDTVTTAAVTAWTTMISLNDMGGINTHTPPGTIPGASDTNGARASLTQYLQGSLLSAGSPLDPMAKYREAKRQYDANLLAAQGGNAEAITNFGSYRDAFLAASQAVYASSGQYNTDFFSSFNAGAALTGGAVQPYTTQAANANTQTIVQALAASTNATIEAATSAVDKTNALLERIASNTAAPATPGALTGTF